MFFSSLRNTDTCVCIDEYESEETFCVAHLPARWYFSESVISSLETFTSVCNKKASLALRVEISWHSHQWTALIYCTVVVTTPAPNTQPSQQKVKN